MILIFLNTVVVMTTHYRQSYDFKRMQSIANMLFTIIFTIECLVKVIAYGLKTFCKDAWCVFDMIVIVGSWVDIIVEFLYMTLVNTSFFRLFRAARVAKLAGKDGNLRQLFATLMSSMKSVPPIAFLLLLIMYMYAILGMQVS